MYGINWEGDDVEAKFKVGDRVSVVKDGEGGSWHQAEIGAVGAITEIDKNGYYRGIDGWYFKPHEIQPAFRPGDRVKLNRHSGIRACGERGVVILVRDSTVSVNMDEWSLCGSRVERLPVDVLDWERAEDVADAPASAADCSGRNEQPKPKPKFKAGDVVKYKGSTSTKKIIKDVKTHYSTGVAVERIAYNYESGGWDFETCLELAAPCPQDNEQPMQRLVIPWSRAKPQPAIVALTKNGQPLPSYRPHLHASVADATKEAERLARNNLGQEFAVYQRVTARVAEVHVQMKEVA